MMRQQTLFRRVLAMMSVAAIGAISACAVPGEVTSQVEPSTTSGSLVVSLKLERRIQATVAEVERVVVRLKLDWPHEERVQTIEKDALLSGQGSVTFAAVRQPGGWIELTALDATGKTLGTRQAWGGVVAGQVSQVNLPFQLDPTVVSSGPPASGGLSTEFTFNAPLPTTGTVTALPAPDAYTSYRRLMGIDAVGFLYLATPIGYEKYSSQGIKMASVPNPASVALNRGVVDSAGNIWVRDTNSKLWKVGPDGAVLGQFPIAGYSLDGYTGTYFHPNGDVWVILSSGGIARFSASGAAVGTLPIVGALSMAFTTTGEAWINANGKLVKTSPAGDVLKEISIPAPARSKEFWAPELTLGRPLVDSDGNVWVTMPGYSVIFKLSADGQILGQYPGLIEANWLYEDHSGHIWAVSGNDTDSNLMKLSKSGSIVGVNRAGSPIDRPFMDPQGNLWWTDLGSKKYFLARLTP